MQMCTQYLLSTFVICKLPLPMLSELLIVGSGQALLSSNLSIALAFLLLAISFLECGVAPSIIKEPWRE